MSTSHNVSKNPHPQPRGLYNRRSGRPSLAVAARRFNVSGPAAVRAVGRLEARPGESLLQRSAQGVVLTRAGEAFMADCSHNLQ
nr:LysR family transcriptional regulator [Pseudomonas petrae]